MNLDPDSIRVLRNGEAPEKVYVEDGQLVLVFPDGAKIIIPVDGYSIEGNQVSIEPGNVLVAKPGEEPVKVSWTESKLKAAPDGESVDEGMSPEEKSVVGQIDEELQWRADWEDSPLSFAPLPRYDQDNEVHLYETDQFIIPTLNFRVSDEGLPGGLPDDVGDQDLTNSVVASGSFDLSVKPDSITLDILSDDITSGGVPLVWTNNGSQTVIGSAGGKPIIIARISDDGHFTVRQLGPIDHEGQGEDELPIDFKVTFHCDSFTTQTMVTVVVEDDSPISFANSNPVEVFDLDETLPLGSDLDGPGNTPGLRSVSKNLSGNFGVQYGADGPGPTRYFGLSLNGDQIPSGVFAVQPGDSSTTDGDGFGQGSEILLSQTDENTITGSADGVVHFTIVVDPDTGMVTFTQHNNVWHPNTGDSDDMVAILTKSPSDLQVTSSVSDGDGDISTGTINLGSNIFRIEDDGPVGTLVLNSSIPLTLDETRPEGGDRDGPGETAGIRSASADYSNNFTADFGEDGPGESPAGAYQLTLNGQSISSGLYAVQSGDRTTGDGDGYGQGQEILLSKSGSVITGSADGVGYFTITVDPDDGIITFTQLENIWHPSAGDGDDLAALVTQNSADLQVTRVVSDGDGDVSVAGISLGNGVFRIEDDAPTATVLANQVATITLDESRPGGIVSATHDFSGNFSADFGADGEGEISYNMALNGPNVSSGLYALEPGDQSVTDGDGYGQGAEILMSQTGNTITGTAGGVVYFTISANPNTGVVTFTQNNNIWHPDESDPDDVTGILTANASDIQITQTVTDADGDAATASIDLGNNEFRIEDDGPAASISLNTGAQIVVDETLGENAGEDETSSLGSVTVSGSTLFTSSMDTGEDDEGASLVFSLEVSGGGNSGLYLTGSSTEIILVENAGVIEGREGGGGGTLAFHRGDRYNVG